jgi:hypothetical protein
MSAKKNILNSLRYAPAPLENPHASILLRTATLTLINFPHWFDRSISFSTICIFNPYYTQQLYFSAFPH